MNSLFKKILKGDTTLWLIFIIFCVASVPIMFSASSTLAYQAKNYSVPMFNHAQFLIFGFLLAVGIHYIPYKYIRILSYLGLFVSILLLIYVQVNGVTTNAATRWVNISGIRFQPSELAKLSLLIVVADCITRAKSDASREKYFFWWIIAFSALTCLLILFDNFSTAFLLALVVFLMLFIGSVASKQLLYLTLGLILILLLSFFVVKLIPVDTMPTKMQRAYTWVNRIDRFIESKEDDQKFVITDETLQEKRGLMAIATGGCTVFGMGNSEQRDYLPQAYADFIFAIILEEFGFFVGGVLLILAYLALLFRAGQIATKCKSIFPSFLVIGLTLMIVVQALMSMAVVTGIGPVTGQPLPLMSRGGTAILITCVYFGVILGVTRQIKEEQAAEANELAGQDDMTPIELDDL